MFEFREFLSVFADAEDIYFDVYDHHDREVFYGKGLELLDTCCIKVVLHRDILRYKEDITDSWKNHMLETVYAHVKAEESAGVYDGKLTSEQIADIMCTEIGYIISDSAEEFDSPELTTVWIYLKDDCDKYVLYV